jgi:hypothetical protein
VSQLSRKRSTIFLQEVRFLSCEKLICSRHSRQNFLYICGKIGLTLCALLVSLFKAVNEAGKLEQISHAKGRATCCKDHRGIRWGKAGPSRWQRPDAIRRLVKRDTVLSPVVPVAEHFKLLAVQGMKGMSDREISFR